MRPASIFSYIQLSNSRVYERLAGYKELLLKLQTDRLNI